MQVSSLHKHCMRADLCVEDATLTSPPSTDRACASNKPKRGAKITYRALQIEVTPLHSHASVFVGLRHSLKYSFSLA
jgi:hypothetical protein